MATNNYQASFNSGELSRKMDGRSDLDVYRNGCRLLQNFYVMPQGGVERRTGTEFVDYTNGGFPIGSIADSTYNSTTGVIGGSNSGVAMNATGTKLYSVASDQNYLTEYDVSPAWDLSTASQVNNVDLAVLFNPVPGVGVDPSDLQISTDGLIFWILDTGTKVIYKYTLTTEWDISTIQAPANQSGDISSDFGYNPEGFSISSDGLSVYLTAGTNVYKHELTTAFDVSTMQSPVIFDAVANLTFGSSISVRSDSEAYIVVDITGNELLLYSMTTAGDLSTSVFIDALDISAKSTTCSAIWANADWTHTAIVDFTSEDVFLYSMEGFPLILGEASARLIPFVFSSDDAYAMEFGDGYIKAWYVDDNGASQSVGVTGVVPYAVADVREVQYVQRFDTLILTHPLYATQSLTRDTLTPTFSILETAFDYPPLLEENDTVTTIAPSATTGTGIDLVAVGDDTFVAGHVGSTWRISHERSNAQLSQTGDFSSTQTGAAFDVSYSNWRIVTSKTWQGLVIILRSVDGGAFERYVVVGDSTNLSDQNFSFDSPTKEGANTQLKVEFTHSSSTMGYNLTTDNPNWDGLVLITAVTDTKNAVADVVSELGNTTATTLWAEGSFSTFRGFPATASWHQDRLWFAGTAFEPATLYGSVSGDYYNFITGTEDDLSIKRIIDSPEESKWLLSKRFLFLGTAGSSITAKSADKNALITAGNIDTNSQSVYGSAPIQALLANDVVLYVQKNGLKVREMIYNWEEENYKSNDITILSENITDSGIVETFLQKQPDQNFWAIKANGDIGLLTYERGQEVVGWSRIETDGEVISGCAIPNENGEDQVWICVKRLGKYLIERFHPRVDLDWYVDSAVKYDGGACVTADSIDVNNFFQFLITDSDNSVSDGEKIRFKNMTGGDYLDNQVFTVADRTSSDFKLKTEDGSAYLNSQLDNYEVDIITISGGTTVDGGVPSNGELEGRATYLDTGVVQIKYSVGIPTKWRMVDVATSEVWTAPQDTFYQPPKSGWSTGSLGSPAPTISYETLEGDYCIVQNSLSGLDHLEGETVQVVVDGNYHSDQLVESGAVALDVYGNTILAGLQYVSKLQPMPIEPVTGESRSQSRKKAVTKVSLLFYKTLGAKVGEPDLLETNFAALKTSDIAGEPLSTFSGEVRVFMANNWERQKVIQIKQDLPYPMTVLSMSVWTKVTGA